MTGLLSRMRVGPMGPSPAGSTRLGLPAAIFFKSAPAQNWPWSPQNTATLAVSSISKEGKKFASLLGCASLCCGIC